MIATGPYSAQRHLECDQVTYLSHNGLHIVDIYLLFFCVSLSLAHSLTLFGFTFPVLQ